MGQRQRRHAARDYRWRSDLAHRQSPRRRNPRFSRHPRHRHAHRLPDECRLPRPTPHLKNQRRRRALDPPVHQPRSQRLLRRHRFLGCATRHCRGRSTRRLEGLDQKDLIIEDYVSGILGDILERHCPPKEHVANWDLKALKSAIFTSFGVDIYAEGLKPEEMNRQELGDAIFDKLKQRYDAKEKLIGAEAMRYHERMIMLSVIDGQWKDHLLSMDHLKEGINLRG